MNNHLIHEQGKSCPACFKSPAPLWLTPVIALAMIVLLAYVGPALDDHSAENGAAKNSIAQQQRVTREARAAREICGENAAWQIDGSVLQCFTHRGARTVTAKVTQ